MKHLNGCLQINIKMNKKFSLKLMSVFSIGIILLLGCVVYAAEESQIDSITDIANLPEDTIQDETNLYNLGYHFGGGVDYSLGEDTSIFLTLVYENGFIDVFKSGPPINSRVLSIRLGINF